MKRIDWELAGLHREERHLEDDEYGFEADRKVIILLGEIAPKIAKGFKDGNLKLKAMGITNAEDLQLRKYKKFYTEIGAINAKVDLISLYLWLLELHISGKFMDLWWNVYAGIESINELLYGIRVRPAAEHELIIQMEEILEKYEQITKEKIQEFKKRVMDGPYNRNLLTIDLIKDLKQNITARFIKNLNYHFSHSVDVLYCLNIRLAITERTFKDFVLDTKKETMKYLRIPEDKDTFAKFDIENKEPPK